MRSRSVKINTAAVVGFAVAGALFAAPMVAQADSGQRAWNQYGGSGNSGKVAKLQAVGLADEGKQLVSFRTEKVKNAKPGVAVSGFSGEETFLIGIDYRVQDGKLYGVGNGGGLYTISERDAKLTSVGKLSVAPAGTTFGVDFNPAANALRVISDTGQNLRQPFADTPLAATVTDTPLTNALPPGGTPTGVTAAAYTNNDLSLATATTLFDINTTAAPADQVVIQSPANAGLLVPAGALGVDAALDAGFDIYATVRDGRAVDNLGFATLTAGGTSQLFAINLLTGEAAGVGTFRTPVTDLAIGLNQL